MVRGPTDQLARRARALRRLSARRSSSDRPPHTPASCPDSSAHFRQVSCTSQRRQTAFASSICMSAGPVLPIGKKSSGSSSKHAARLRQSIRVTPCFARTLGSCGVHRRCAMPAVRRATRDGSRPGITQGAAIPTLVLEPPLKTHETTPRIPCLFQGHRCRHVSTRGRANIAHGDFTHLRIGADSGSRLRISGLHFTRFCGRLSPPPRDPSVSRYRGCV